MITICYEQGKKTYLKEEICKEFQLAPIVLFSDAVNAIVITLMAIEIPLLQISEKLTAPMLLKS